MSRAQRRPSKEDQALFRAAAAGAKPLPDSRIHHEPPPPPAVPLQRRRDEAEALAESLHPEPLDLSLEGGDEPAFLRPGLARTVLRDLRRGRWVVQEALDLHGATREEARRLVAEFLAESMRRGLRCVRIVHGKGLRSGQRGPVLKQTVNSLLRRFAAVVAFSSARQVDGGTGAVYVLLG